MFRSSEVLRHHMEDRMFVPVFKLEAVNQLHPKHLDALMSDGVRRAEVKSHAE
jgi:hypothetical protein